MCKSTTRTYSIFNVTWYQPTKDNCIRIVSIHLLDKPDEFHKPIKAYELSLQEWKEFLQFTIKSSKIDNLIAWLQSKPMIVPPTLPDIEELDLLTDNIHSEHDIIISYSQTMDNAVKVHSIKNLKSDSQIKESFGEEVLRLYLKDQDYIVSMGSTIQGHNYILYPRVLKRKTFDLLIRRIKAGSKALSKIRKAVAKYTTEEWRI